MPLKWSAVDLDGGYIRLAPESMDSRYAMTSDSDLREGVAKGVKAQ